MQALLSKFDRFAGLETTGGIALALSRVGYFFVLVMVAAAPHSIAATQIAWGIGTIATFARFAIGQRPKLRITWLDIALWAFLVWSAVSGFFSYEPFVSLNKLRSVALFLIFYFVIWNVKNLRAAYLAAFLLIVSCGVNLIWTPVERYLGRGVEIHGLAPDGPLAKALLTEGDTLLRADGRKLATPDDLVAALAQKDTVKVLFYRPDFEFAVDVKAADLKPDGDADARLGIASWTKSHNWRSMGFYNHYVTYAEVLQLIASLIFGLLAAAIRRRRAVETVEPSGGVAAFLSRTFTSTWFLTLALAFACLALLMTVTRASQLGFMVSAFVIVLLTASRKFLITAIVVAIPIIFFALLFLQQSRQVGFFDSHDDSTKYREMMWRDGARILTDSPRHLIVGVGMDSIQRHWQEWGMYDGGNQPMGHFHSTPIQLAVERGIPAVILWLMVLIFYARRLWVGIRKTRFGDWRAFGILLGCSGGLVGFCTSGLVHWNLGDAEVAMVFFILMAIAVKVSDLFTPEPADAA